ncbi:MAG: RluA family pseudouridine synthase [Clostridia bacterium]|nr:RluA family pseudouridine synthase [Clostridia bacterium]
MRTIVIKQEQANKRIDRVLKEIFPHVPMSAVYKALRKKDIKANGVRIKEDYTVMPGDKLDIYIVDEILDGSPQDSGEFTLNKGFTVVYEDKHILVVNKEQGIPVHPDREQSSNTLIDLVQSYLKEKGEYNPTSRSSFPPSLCHRLDRNTGGLVMIAKDDDTLKIILDKMKTREIKKYYQCLVKGVPEKESAELKAYLEKDEKKSRVFVSDKKTRDSVEIITRYMVLSHQDDIARLEVELVTGRTHQIRAHLAHIGHPIIGDGKYGTNAVNRSAGAKYQALWAYKLVFDFKNAGILNYLKGKVLEVEPEFKTKNK